MKTYRIAVIAGDGIGQEVIPAGIEVMKIAAAQGRFQCEFTDFPWGSDFYLRTGRMLDPDGIEQMLKFDAIYLGAIGDPRVADHITAREMILPFRQQLRQYVNLRPMRLLPGIDSPLRGRTAADIDMVCVRENSEGEYCGIGGRLHRGTPDELAEQTGIFTRRGIERIARYAFTLAQTRPRRLLASATKSSKRVSWFVRDRVICSFRVGSVPLGLCGPERSGLAQRGDRAERGRGNEQACKSGIEPAVVSREAETNDEHGEHPARDGRKRLGRTSTGQIESSQDRNEQRHDEQGVEDRQRTDNRLQDDCQCDTNQSSAGRCKPRDTQ